MFVLVLCLLRLRYPAWEPHHGRSLLPQGRPCTGWSPPQDSPSILLLWGRVGLHRLQYCLIEYPVAGVVRALNHLHTFTRKEVECVAETVCRLCWWRMETCFVVFARNSFFDLSWNTLNHCWAPPGSSSTMVGLEERNLERKYGLLHSRVSEKTLHKNMQSGRKYLSFAGYPNIVSACLFCPELNYEGSNKKIIGHMDFTGNHSLFFKWLTS